MEKALTFIDKNRMWFSFGTVMLIVSGAMWLMVSLNSINTAITLLNTNLNNFVQNQSERTAYVDYRMNDFELRLRACEQSRL